MIPFYKRLSKYEISCVLFQQCNLKCDFCFEPNQQRSKFDESYIKNLPHLTKSLFDQNVDYQNQLNYINLMFWGGEVFMDGLKDIQFNLYYDMLSQYQQLFSSFNKLSFSWLSNGVFTKKDRVLDLMNTFPQNILGFSYDPIGRFKSNKQRSLMISNCEIFRKKGKLDRISITITKPNIQSFLEDYSILQYFKDLGLSVDVNFYIPNPGWEKYLPSDQEVFDFFKMCIDNKFDNVIVVKKILDYWSNTDIEKHCDCHQCSQITNGIWSVDCAKRSSSLHSSMFFEQPVNESNTNQIKASNGIIKRGCLTCPYNDRCQQPCWIGVIFKHFTSSMCPFQKAIQYCKN